MKIQRPQLPPAPSKVEGLTPQEIAQKIASEGLKGTVEKAIESGGHEYRAHYKKLLESKQGSFRKGIGRFQSTEAEADTFLEEIYNNLPAFFKKMVDDTVEEQAGLNGLSRKHKDELRRELANVIDQEIRLKGKFA